MKRRDNQPEYECVMRPKAMKKLKSKTIHTGAVLYNLPTKALMITEHGEILVAAGDSEKHGRTRFVPLESMQHSAHMMIENFSEP